MREAYVFSELYEVGLDSVKNLHQGTTGSPDLSGPAQLFDLFA